ncbi:protein of unknown function [Candidatus Nitrosocosmicus franklandus]|uniref:Uncharacterized protein n=1 Tax=Candidatus Nitrosocosmicus franklandianus TaxID=1798806 RepID=A0A484IEJ5_9ARCH|nr:protein of unknown function [Candidatus Nitrosocosmicus franklandus]
MKSNTIKGYKLLLADLSPVEVTIELGLSCEEIKEIYLKFLELQGLHNFEKIMKTTRITCPKFFKLLIK